MFIFCVVVSFGAMKLKMTNWHLTKASNIEQHHHHTVCAALLQPTSQTLSFLLTPADQSTSWSVPFDVFEDSSALGEPVMMENFFCWARSFAGKCLVFTTDDSGGSLLWRLFPLTVYMQLESYRSGKRLRWLLCLLTAVIIEFFLSAAYYWRY